MEGRLVLKDCSVYRLDGSFRSGTAVAIEQGRISKVSPDEQIPILPGDWEIACRGRLTMPGLIDCHAHLVSGQLSPFSAELLGQTPAERSRARDELESKLTAAEVEALTAFALARALRFGVTTVLEHLHCPGDVGGGLDAQARTAERVGMRLVGSHATDSRHGPRSALSQLEANAERVLARRAHPLVRCALGFGASSDCDDELLTELGRLRAKLGVGVHGHVAGGEADQARTLDAVNQRVVSRLEARGLLGRQSVVAYASGLTAATVSFFARQSASARNGLVALATGGSISLWDEVVAAWAALAEQATAARTLDAAGMLRDALFGAPASLCSRIFGERFGAIEPGCPADLAVYDLLPAEAGQGPSAELVLRTARAPVAWTIVAGRVVVREGRLLAHDYIELEREAQRALRSIRRRAGADLAPDSPGPGR
jgi:cytosine/adenosine deaminase-related metal-dependent hydrolase